VPQYEEQMMGRKIKSTADGSFTIYDEGVGECFHSIHGAIQESEHVFIRAGFEWCQQPVVRILEVGFGSGLNAYLTLKRAHELQRQVKYTAVEYYPLDLVLVEEYSKCLHEREIFMQLHITPWEEEILLSPFFSINKINADILTANLLGIFDVVYFDAFSPERQPELWQENVFDKIYGAMSDESVLVTYCAKGVIKRRLRQVGFEVESLAGPPGKREITRAIKVVK
jgi:tRNA U34 5-methylaminomethyl-2-thiouridine-forming methyltransferase MnmC